MPRGRRPAIGAAATALVVAGLLVVCQRSGVDAAAARAAPDDSLAAGFLGAVRGAPPVLCEIASAALESGWRHREGGPVRPADPAVREIVTWALDFEGGSAAVGPLAAGLADPDPCVRRMAAVRLGRIDDPAAVRALMDALGSGDAGAREAAALGLGHADLGDVGSPAERDARNALTGVLGDPGWQVRAAAVWALGELEDPAAVPVLIERLRTDRDEWVRRNAARALGEIDG